MSETTKLEVIVQDQKDPPSPQISWLHVPIYERQTDTIKLPAATPGWLDRWAEGWSLEETKLKAFQRLAQIRSKGWGHFWLLAGGWGLQTMTVACTCGCLCLSKRGTAIKLCQCVKLHTETGRGNRKRSNTLNFILKISWFCYTVVGALR